MVKGKERIFKTLEEEAEYIVKNSPSYKKKIIVDMKKDGLMTIDGKINKEDLLKELTTNLNRTKFFNLQGSFK